MRPEDIDRFTGEAKEPPEWGRCGYCGGAIYTGCDYYFHGGLAICRDCAERYAYALFEREALVETAPAPEKGGGVYERG